MFLKVFRPACVLSFLAVCLAASISAQSLGIFEGQSDIGEVRPAGSGQYSLATGVYTVNAAGADIWSSADDMHFLWKKVAGDVALTAGIDFPAKTGTHNPRRKAVLMLRQSLDADSAYVDVAQHGSGFTALQFRQTKGGVTQSIELNIDPPSRVRLEKRGDTFIFLVSLHGEPLHPSGAVVKLHLSEPFYAGIGVCAHDAKTPEEATFSHLEYRQLAPPAVPPTLTLYSTVQSMAIDPRALRSTIVYAAPDRAEAPNWSRDGSSLLFNQDGRLYTVAADGKGTPQPIDTGSATSCSGSHGYSPDGKWIAVSCAMPGMTGRHLLLIPAAGGMPRVLTPDVGYFHSWSPDGKTILFTRGSHDTNNIYAISANGGPETALTTGTGISDDPDFSPDGQSIYFNTDRWGGMQIARMEPDGSGVEQLTFDPFKNWTPHPSPDGKSVVFLSYNADVTTHASDQDITLRILSTDDRKIRVLTNLVGGNGSMNVLNWSPDSKRVAFVSYAMLPAGTAM